MLYLFCYYILITFICFWAGILVYSFIPTEKKSTRSIVNYLITGLITVTAVGQWIVLFSPVRIFSSLFIIIFFGLFSIVRRKQTTELLTQVRSSFTHKSLFFYGSVLCMLIMILILNAGPVIMDDTESYHIQMVKWIQQYGSVPGIANLHLRFGFNSSWFISIAMLSYPVIGLNTYEILNGVLSLWLSYFLLEQIFNYSFSGERLKSQNRGIACGIIFLLCLINWPLIRGSACSANYDFISAACIIILCIELDETENGFPIEWIVWPVFLFTVRMTNFPLLILAGICCLSRFSKFSWKKAVIILAAAGFIIIPFLIRNAVLSGYPFFPVYQMDYFSFDWKADRVQIQELSNFIKYFNRVNPAFQPMAITEKLGFPEWIFSWYHYLFRYDKLMVTLSFIGYGILFFRIRLIKGRLRVFLAVMVIQIILWFFVAPDPRFANGPILFGIFTAILCSPTIKGRIAAPMKYAVILSSAFVLIYGGMKVIRDNQYRNFLVPHALPNPQIQTVVVGGIDLHIPEKVLDNWNPRCYDIKLPCLYIADPRLEPRGDNIDKGFRLKKQR